MAQRVAKFISERYAVPEEKAAEYASSLLKYVDMISEFDGIYLSESKKATIAINSLNNIKKNLRQEQTRRKKSIYRAAVPDVVKFCKEHPEDFFASLYLTAELGIDLNPSGLSNSLSSNLLEFELRKIIDTNLDTTYFGYSPECGPGVCFKSWCLENSNKCKAKNPVKNKTLFKKDGKKTVIEKSKS